MIVESALRRAFVRIDKPPFIGLKESMNHTSCILESTFLQLSAPSCEGSLRFHCSSASCVVKSHPPCSLGPPGFLSQLRCRALPVHNSVLHIRRPQCSTHRIRKSEQDRSHRHEFQEDSSDTKAIIISQPNAYLRTSALGKEKYLAYAALYSSTCFSFWFSFHCFS